MRKWMVLLLTLGLTALPLTGCWDRREINDIAFVVATAFDKQEDQYIASVQVPLPGQMGSVGNAGGGGGTSGEKPWFIDSTAGKNIRDANIKQQKSLSRALYFAHRRVLVLGEDLSKEGIAPVMDVVSRVPQNRLTSFLLIAEGLGRDVLSADAPTEQFPGEMLRELAQNSMKRPQMIKHVVEAMLSDGIDPVVPVVHVTKTHPGQATPSRTNLQMSGVAVFNGENRLAGILYQDKAQGLLMAMDQSRNTQVTVLAPSKDGYITVVFQENRATIIPEIKGDQVTMHIRIRGKGSVVENESTYDLGYNGNLIKIERLVQEKIQSEIKEAVEEAAHRLHADPMGLGLRVYRSYTEDWYRMKKDWPRYLANVKVVVEPNIHIEHTGFTTLPFGRKDGEITR
ncbi:Ger(x)C family spore germination protein [Tumebacillus sp. DT12]|uniref:Ger(X)C family spore germination protein n=1 Tax=Tumebacillus lacus TaxID=2995335 RepID=A0ABT3X4V3_9BACL|nr:Ger(x)C family spore germination protein [Tumebacillus lacus]MCX7571938.1 Ger(x)C family spore germination protein [Tumebacillus lacus]